MGTTPALSTGPAFLDNVPASVRKQLDKLGLRTAFDVVLHLPLRYEDETHLTPLRDARAGDTVQVEAQVQSSDAVNLGVSRALARRTLLNRRAS